MTDIEQLRKRFEAETGQPHRGITYNDVGGVNHFSQKYVEWLEHEAEKLQKRVDEDDQGSADFFDYFNREHHELVKAYIDTKET